MNIREASSNDAKQLCILFRNHAEYEGSSLSANEYEVTQCLKGDYPAQIMVVEQHGELKGYMSLLKQFDTWNMEYYLYMDCLYLEPELRGEGIGKHLMELCKNIAVKSGVKEIQWQTPNSNEQAIGFYQALGAGSKNKQRFFWKLI
jgi:ribosomal protein S18 acetylase RimI-like enzyme